MVKNEVKQSDASASAQLPEMIDSLDLEVTSFNLPDQVKTTVTEESAVSGKRSRTKTKEIPMKASITISKQSPEEQVTALGLTRRPIKDITVSLKERKGKLIADICNSYKGKEVRTRYERYNVRHIKKGQEVAPYCYADRDEIEYDERPVNYQVDVEKTEKVSGGLNEEGFRVLYLGLIRSDSGEPLARYFAEKYPERVENAQNWIRDTLLNEAAEAQKKADLLKTSLDQFSLKPRRKK